MAYPKAFTFYNKFVVIYNLLIIINCFARSTYINRLKVFKNDPMENPCEQVYLQENIYKVFNLMI